MIPRAAWVPTKEIQNGNIVKGSFFVSVRFSLLIAKFLGLLPIDFKRPGSSKRSIWKSLSIVFYYSCLIIHTSNALLYFYDIFSSGFSIDKSNDLFSYLNMVLLKIFLLRFSIKWEVTLKEIETIETSLPVDKSSRNACRNISLIIVVTLHTLALLEYTLYVVFTVRLIADCLNSTHLYLPSLKLYYINKYPWFYKYVPFNYTAGSLFQILEFQAMFLRCFVDGFIMIISIYLKKRFQQFNRILNHKQFKLRDNRPTWTELQIQYTHISRLVMIVDDILNPLLFVALFGNLLYIAQQLFYMLNKLTKQSIITDGCFEQHKHDFETPLFLTYSLVFKVTKIIFLYFLGAELHTASREPLNALYIVPHSAYNVGMYRLMNQIYHSKIALTGLNFFHLTRGTFMSMVAILMTYELVLLQI